MKHRRQSLQPIIDLLAEKWSLSPSEISNFIGKSTVTVHTYLRALVKEGTIQKTGITPHVQYGLVNTQDKISYKTTPLDFIWDYRIQKILSEFFWKFSPNGKILTGASGFAEWAIERGQSVEKKAEDFALYVEYIQSLQDSCGLIDATQVFQKTFSKIPVRKAYFSDQYIYGEFGRGKMAEITFFAKQTQNKQLIDASIAGFIQKLTCLIHREKYDALAIIPWSIERKNQLLKILQKKLQILQVPLLSLEKYSQSGIIIPQKSLKSKKDRIENAKNSILIADFDRKKYHKILLIDDFVGSWASFIETAKKYHALWIKNIDIFAIVGNIDLDYEVVREI